MATLIEKFLLPWTLSNFLSLLLLYLCYKAPKVGRYLFAVLFLLAGCINGYLAIVQPSVYLEYGEVTPLSFYKEFIYGYFSQNIMVIILSIAISQLGIGLGFLLDGRWLIPAAIGAAIFLLAIAPLGVGSAFPATLFMVLAIWVLLLKTRQPDQA